MPCIRGSHRSAASMPEASAERRDRIGRNGYEDVGAARCASEAQAAVAAAHEHAEEADPARAGGPPGTAAHGFVGRR